MRPRGDAAALAALLGVALLWYGGLTLFDRADPATRAEERLAARTMAEAIRTIAEEAAARGFPPDPAVDPNRTGLIGLPFSPITTTLGSLPAKRTGAQPEAAALMARLLRQAGVRPGDRVALDSSGSFPGFAVATLAAAQALGAEAVAVASIGSSTYGANRPEFTLPDMLGVLARKGVLPGSLAAVSPGGDGDAGGNLDPAALEAALARARSAGAAIIRTPDLAADIAAKRAVFGTPRVLVSVGGNWASAGMGAGLPGHTGLILPGEFSPGGPAGTGLIQSSLREGVPVIRILDVQDLCVHTGLPFDPIPWPTEGVAPFEPPSPARRLLVGAGPVLALLAAFLARRWAAFRASSTID